MKRAVFLVILSVMIILQSVLLSLEPNFQWEKTIKTVNAEEVQLQKLLDFGEGYALIYHSRFDGAFKINPGIIIIDKDRTIKNLITYSQPYEAIVKHAYFQNGMFNLIIREVRDFNYFASVQADEKGNFVNRLSDNSYFYGTNNASIFYNDSLYNIAVKYGFPYVQVYNSKAFYVRSFYYDSANIAYNVIKQYIPVCAFTSEGKMISAFHCSDDTIQKNVQYMAFIENDLNGNILYSKKFSLDTVAGTQVFSMFVQKDGGIITSGYVRDGKGNENPFIARLDKEFNLKKYNILLEEGNKSGIYSLKALSGRRYALYGSYRPHGCPPDIEYFWLLIFDEDCNIVSEYIWGGIVRCRIDDIADGENGTIIVYGRKNNNLYLACIQPEYTSVDESEVVSSIRVSPNPACGYITVENRDEYMFYECTAFDIAGKPAGRFTIAPFGRIPVDVSGWLPGSYFLVARQGGKSLLIKFVVEK